jgi:hypothetical protein
MGVAGDGALALASRRNRPVIARPSTSNQPRAIVVAASSSLLPMLV